MEGDSLVAWLCVLGLGAVAGSPLREKHGPRCRRPARADHVLGQASGASVLYYLYADWEGYRCWVGLRWIDHRLRLPKEGWLVSPQTAPPAGEIFWLTGANFTHITGP